MNLSEGVFGVKMHLLGMQCDGFREEGSSSVFSFFKYETRVKLFGESHEVKIDAGNLKFHLKMERVGWKIDTFA